MKTIKTEKITYRTSTSKHNRHEWRCSI